MNPNWSTAIANEYGGEILRWYEGLEAQVMDFIHVVSPHGNNQLVWSSQLATVLVEACCLIESIFYHFKDDAATEQGKSKSGAHLTLGNYADLFGGLLRLPERRAILLTDILEYRCPFAAWRDLLNGAPFDAAKHVPEWWDLYNRSKHRRITAFPEFTLTMALDALAGALMVISTVPSFTHMMLRHEWLTLNGHGAPELFVQDFQQMLYGPQRMTSAWPYAVVTTLFALPVGPGQFPADPKDLRPFSHGSNPRLFRHFGNY